MLMTQDQLQQYEDNGFVLIQDYLSPREVAILRSGLSSVFSEDSPRRVVEKGGEVVRSVYGSHQTNEVYSRLTRHPRLLEPAKQILGSDVYVYQFKINAKAAFGGDLWDWHQDYIFWNKEDGMPSSRVVSLSIFLDEVNEFNGPLLVIPKSHREGMVELPGARGAREETYKNSPAWISNLTADLKYALDRRTISGMVERYGIVAPKGPAGSVMFFHGNLVHASTNNISPFDRVVIIITYNSVENVPVEMENARPEFLVSRDVRPVSTLPEEALLG